MSAYQPAADPTAVVGKRVVAFIIDLIIWYVIFGAAFLLLSDSGDVDRVTCSGTCATLGDTVYGVGGGKAALLWLVFFWGYLIGIFGILDGIKGFTPGKAVLGLRTVDEQGQAPGAGKGIIRALFLIVDFYFCLLIGLITAIATKQHQRVGDMVAKTFVVAKADAGRPIGGGAAAVAAEPYGTPVGAAPGFGAPAAPYTPPVAEPYSPPVAAEPAAAAAPAGSEPQWDPARNAYIQWDAAQGVWLQFNDATQQWNPIDQ